MKAVNKKGVETRSQGFIPILQVRDSLLTFSAVIYFLAVIKGR